MTHTKHKRPLFTRAEREAAMKAKLLEQSQARGQWRDPKRRGCY